jgi:hypothetical protein
MFRLSNRVPVIRAVVRASSSSTSSNSKNGSENLAFPAAGVIAAAGMGYAYTYPSVSYCAESKLAQAKKEIEDLIEADAEK